jgi:hypothetical protein
MLGEKLGSERGRITGRRVLPADDFRFMKMEISFETEVELLGMQGQEVGTYVVYERGPGQMYGEGQGVVMLADGSGAIWNGHGVAQPTADGGIMVAASIAFQTTNEKLSRLNEVLTLVEHHAHADGTIHSDLWAWTVQPH